MTSIICMTFVAFFWQDTDVHEAFRVVNQLVTVRVIGPDGKAMPDLTPDRFRLTCNGKPIRVESAIWLPSGSVPTADLVESEDTPEESDFQALPDRVQIGRIFIDTTVEAIAKPRQAQAETSVVEKPGRLIVFTVQQDIGSRRNDGLVRTIRQCEGMLEQLEPEDWVAVSSFGSHLKLHLDFSRDRAEAREALRRCLTNGPGRMLIGGLPPSVGAFLDDEEAKQAADLETGLTVLARALGNLPGEKLMTLVGYGVGSFGPSGVTQNRRFDEMINALSAADVVVCSLDLTVFDFHSLEVSLMGIAEATGGFYERTVHHPQAGARRILEALRGAYQLSFSLPTNIVDPVLELRIVDVPNARVSFNQPRMKRL